MLCLAMLFGGGILIALSKSWDDVKAITGVAVGIMLVIGALVWIFADDRRQNDECEAAGGVRISVSKYERKCVTGIKVVHPNRTER